jgi:hypothetical protein
MAEPTETPPADVPAPVHPPDLRTRVFVSGPRSPLSEFARVLRIAAEFVKGFRHFHFVGPCVTVFGAARFSQDHPYYGLAREIGRRIARAGATTMTEGGPGIMEAA